MLEIAHRMKCGGHFERVASFRSISAVYLDNICQIVTAAEQNPISRFFSVLPQDPSFLSFLSESSIPVDPSWSREACAPIKTICLESDRG
jgi:hypothetical protein